jgi:hypothetical protein
MSLLARSRLASRLGAGKPWPKSASANDPAVGAPDSEGTVGSCASALLATILYKPLGRRSFPSVQRLIGGACFRSLFERTSAWIGLSFDWRQRPMVAKRSEKRSVGREIAATIHVARVWHLNDKQKPDHWRVHNGNLSRGDQTIFYFEQLVGPGPRGAGQSTTR